MHLSDDSLMRDFAAACDVVEKVMRKRDIVEGGTGYGWSLPLELIEPDPAMLEAARQSANRVSLSSRRTGQGSG